MNNHDTTIALKKESNLQGYFESTADTSLLFAIRCSQLLFSLLPLLRPFLWGFHGAKTAKSTTRGKFVVAFINLLCVSFNNSSLLYSCHNKIIKFQLLTTFILQPSSWIVLSSQKSSEGVNCWMSIWQVSFNTFSVKMHSTKQCKIKVRLLLCWHISLWHDRILYLMSSFICYSSVRTHNL